MKIPYYQVNAFTSSSFGGNPAGVCIFDEWPDDSTLAALAAENDLSETAFLVGGEGKYDLRWFTPKVEVDLCGHATLASGFVVMNYLEKDLGRVEFSTRSGPLFVSKGNGKKLEMDFPSRPGSPADASPRLSEALGVTPSELYLARDHLAVFDSEEIVRSIEPDFKALLELESMAVIVTAPGYDSDFVSRFFAPKVGINEDPVTGSAHCTLVPYWSSRLGKRELHAFQLSRRQGELWLEDKGQRVVISGETALYLEGRLYW